MEIQIEVSSELRELTAKLRPDFDAALTRINTQAVTMTANYIKDWYRERGEGYFDGPRHFGAARTYMRTIMTAWHTADVGADGFSVYFDAGEPTMYGLRLHHLGGTIRPRNVMALTIPLIPEARGKRAAEYAQKFHELFVVNKNGDKEKGVLAQDNGDGTITAVYALRRSSYVPPLRERAGKEAVPTEEELGRVIEKEVADGIIREWAK